MTIEVVTFGCRLNACESEAIGARARVASGSLRRDAVPALIQFPAGPRVT